MVMYGLDRPRESFTFFLKTSADRIAKATRGGGEIAVENQRSVLINSIG